MDLSTISGLELMRALADGSVPPASISTTMPMHEFAIEPGRVRFTARADDRHLNPLGMVHGGFACTVLDSATGIAVHSTLEANAWLATVDLNVKFFRPLPKNESVFVEGWITNTSQTLVFSEGRIKSENGKLLAAASAIYMIKRATPSASSVAPE